MGILNGLVLIWPDLEQSSTYEILSLFSNAAFTFLPIIVAVSAARVFGGNIFLGAVIGMIMVHPSLLNAWNVASEIAAGHAIPTADVWFGLYKINMTGYQGHVIPVIIAVWFMCFLEKRLHKIVPGMIDLFVTPLVTVLVTGYLTLSIFGPVFSILEEWVLIGIQWIITIPYGIGAAIAGAVYPLTVVCGIHHMYNTVEARMLSVPGGYNTWMPIASSANFAQGAACFAVALKSKDKKFKSLAMPSSFSAFLGITEPAIFGVNLRLMKPLICGMIGGAVGAAIGSTLDIGADKQADYFNLPKEDNPALGYRAIRICLTRHDIFKAQLRALLRASAFGKISIMFPMIISVREVKDAKEVLEECRKELIAEGKAVGDVEIGIMIETPASVMIAEELAQEVEFFSIGTNDLTQYTLAIDRQNPKLDPFYDPHHPAVLRMIEQTVKAGHKHNCWVGICGELGADTALTETFMRMGLDELSVNPGSILGLRKVIRSLDLSK